VQYPFFPHTATANTLLTYPTLLLAPGGVFVCDAMMNRPATAAMASRAKSRRVLLRRQQRRLWWWSSIGLSAGVIVCLLLFIPAMQAFAPLAGRTTQVPVVTTTTTTTTRLQASTMADDTVASVTENNDDEEGSGKSPQKSKKVSTTTTATHRKEEGEDTHSNNNTKDSARTDSTTDDDDFYPWSQAQDWALKDNLPKYLVRIPSSTKNKNNKQSSLLTVALWRSLLQDVPELAGYPVNILQAKYKQQQQLQATKESPSTAGNVDDIGVLPFLQDYEFSAQGGVCGTVYGLEGVADGSRIETSAVHNVQQTLPQGYVQTSDGSMAFEMGRPLTEDAISSNSNNKLPSSWKVISGASSATAQQLAKTGIANGSNNALAEEADGYLVRLGAVTGIVLAGATAINMLSHHMTVNVFWV
jgi:hypothetical protein